jgi:hypothetical protein
MRELAATRELLVATHMPFPSVGHVAVAGDAFVGYRPPGITDRLLGQGRTKSPSRTIAP